MLYERQMSFRKKRSTIRMVAKMIRRVQQAWAERRLAGILLMDIKGTFYRISINCLLRTVKGMSAGGNLMR